jgi:release factor glutamine methyltransferase
MPRSSPRSDAPTWRAIRDAAAEQLRGIGGEASATEAHWIALEASGATPEEWLEIEDEPVTALAAHRVDTMIERRRAGEPLQYVLGSWSFLDLDLMVDRRVLIPRPETEVVAQVAIDEVVRTGARIGKSDPWSAGLTTYTVADLGTGSGALALALVNALPDAAVWATDASGDALSVARANVASLGSLATRVRLVEGDWFDALPIELRGELRLVVSNPPYIATHEVDALPAEVIEHEPIDALVSGPTGLECLERIIGDAVAWLEPEGVLVCEIAPHQAETVATLARDAGFAHAEVQRDLAARDRVLVARR